jgi:hypothetical protein
MALPLYAAEPRVIAPPTRIPVAVETPPVAAGEPVNTSAMPREVRRAVVADAARRFNVPESAVVLTGAEQITWSDGSLGCPEPGRFYTQMLVPGFRVVARTSAGVLRYHTDGRANAVTCGIVPSKPARRLSDQVHGGQEPLTAPPPPGR